VPSQFYSLLPFLTFRRSKTSSFAAESLDDVEEENKEEDEEWERPQDEECGRPQDEECGHPQDEECGHPQDDEQKADVATDDFPKDRSSGTKPACVWNIVFEYFNRIQETS